ncbi:MAG: MaoC family dehydratase [Acidobacteriota bacterium]
MAEEIGTNGTTQRVIESVEALKELLNQEIAVSEYFHVTQERINQFAEVTEDRQWIHVDPERAEASSPFRKTVAHGFLTLSLLPQFLASAVRVRGVRLAINYGLNYVRFPAPVRTGSNVRARFTLKDWKQGAGYVQIAWLVTVECQGLMVPSCVAEWVVRYYA